MQFKFRTGSGAPYRHQLISSRKARAENLHAAFLFRLPSSRTGPCRFQTTPSAFGKYRSCQRECDEKHDDVEYFDVTRGGFKKNR